jgi:hypothetical protein
VANTASQCERPIGKPCTFQIGVRAVADQIGRGVGRGLENPHFSLANGNAEQRTTAHHGQGGLPVWRKADNWTSVHIRAEGEGFEPPGLITRPFSRRLL